MKSDPAIKLSQKWCVWGCKPNNQAIENLTVWVKQFWSNEQIISRRAIQTVKVSNKKDCTSSHIARPLYTKHGQASAHGNNHLFLARGEPDPSITAIIVVMDLQELSWLRLPWFVLYFPYAYLEAKRSGALNSLGRSNIFSLLVFCFPESGWYAWSLSDFFFPVYSNEMMAWINTFLTIFLSDWACRCDLRSGFRSGRNSLVYSVSQQVMITCLLCMRPLATPWRDWMSLQIQQLPSILFNLGRETINKSNKN